MCACALVIATIQIVRLMEPLGPAATDATVRCATRCGVHQYEQACAQMNALVVSAETAGGVEQANAARANNGIGALAGVTVPLVDGG
jgi:hypothetical protein